MAEDSTDGAAINTTVVPLYDGWDLVPPPAAGMRPVAMIYDGWNYIPSASTNVSSDEQAERTGQTASESDLS